MTALREIVVFIRSREGYNCAIARGVPRAYKTTISRILKQSLILLYAEKKVNLWHHLSLSLVYLHGCFLWVYLWEYRLDLDSSLSKIFLQFWGWAGPVGNMEKHLRFHMTPHLLSITFRITTDKGFNLELKKKNDFFFFFFFAWSRNARRLLRDCIACNLYGKNFSTQHRVRDQTP